AAEAKSKYELRIMGSDKNYVYLEAKPRRPQDRADFVNARLALTVDSFLPRQLILMEANGNVSTWDIPSIQANVPINDPTIFAAPRVQAGWKLERAPDGPPAPANPPGTPRVFRSTKGPS